MASPPPVLSTFVGVNTLGSLANRIKIKVNEPMGEKKMEALYDDIADGIESIWMSALLATLSKFIKGPITQVIPANSTSVQIISVPDPTAAPYALTVPGGSLLSRTLYFSYCLVTESGSTTLCSPLAPLSVPASRLANVPPPIYPSTQTVPDGVIGWYLFAGYNPSGSDQGQQSLSPLTFNHGWYEPPAGITEAPSAPAPPNVNTTGDNIFAIERIDVQNVDQTWTNWIQTNLASTFFTEFQHKISTTTTWMPFVYDLIDNRQLEVRPGPAADLPAVYFYIHKPRRPRFPQSRLPFTSFACQAFLFNYAMSRTLLGFYEFEAADRWNKYAEEERQRIVLQIGQGNWNRDTTVRPFMR